MSVRDWFIAPLPPGSPESSAGSASAEATAWTPPAGDASASRGNPPAWTPPAGPAGAARGEAPAWAPPAGAAGAARADMPRPGAAGAAGAARADMPAAVIARGLASAAVLGRAGEAEPFAAALALALRRGARAPAASVVVIGGGETEPAAGGGTRAARRLAARLAAHGFAAAEKGRLAWVRLPAGAAAGARRAAVVGAPAVLAVTAPLTPALEAAIAELDLAVVVTSDGEGPLAQLAAASLASGRLPVVVGRPLPRGVSRWLTRAGLRAPRPVRELAARAGGEAR